MDALNGWMHCVDRWMDALDGWMDVDEMNEDKEESAQRCSIENENLHRLDRWQVKP